MFNKRLLANSVLFFTGWLICLTFNSTVVFISTLIILLIHFRFIGSWQKEIVLITLFLGSAIDSFLGNLNILHFAEGSRLLPLPMACIWALLGTTVRHSMNAFNNRLWLAILTGCVFAPINYCAASLNPHIYLSKPDNHSLIMLAVIWSILMPLLLGFSEAWKKRYKRNNL